MSAVVVELKKKKRRLVATCLCRLGLVVYEAKDGAEAARLLEQMTPDLVCLDLRLPDGNGLSVCELMRKSDRLHDVPGPVLTAPARPPALEAAEADGGAAD